MVIIVKTDLDKNILFQSILITMKNGIILVIFQTLALIANQVCIY